VRSTLPCFSQVSVQKNSPLPRAARRAGHPNEDTGRCDAVLQRKLPRRRVTRGGDCGLRRSHDRPGREILLASVCRSARMITQNPMEAPRAAIHWRLLLDALLGKWSPLEPACPFRNDKRANVRRCPQSTNRLPAPPRKRRPRFVDSERDRPRPSSASRSFAKAPKQPSFGQAVQPSRAPSGGQPAGPCGRAASGSGQPVDPILLGNLREI
jgi:hypothetical protein